MQAAAKQYFNKNVWELNLSECVTLAGITQNPTQFNPIEHPEANSKRRKEVLDHMLDQQYITQEQYDQVINDNVYAEIQAAQAVQAETADTIYSYFEDELIDQVINDLMNIKGYTRIQCRTLYTAAVLKFTPPRTRGSSLFWTKSIPIQKTIQRTYSTPWIMPLPYRFLGRGNQLQQGNDAALLPE